MTILLLTPAYGRRYSSEDEAFADWINGRDFKIPRGPYLSIRDVDKLRAAGYSLVRIILRYPTGREFAEWPIHSTKRDDNPAISRSFVSIRRTDMTKAAALLALQCLKTDLALLASGDWVPDKDSIAASQEMLERVRHYVEETNTPTPHQEAANAISQN